MIFKWLEEKCGYSPKEVSIIAGTYQGLNVITFGLLWVGCYKYNPRLIIKQLPRMRQLCKNIKGNYPNVSQKIITKIDSVKHWSENNKYIHGLSEKIGAKPKRVTGSFLEAFVIDKLGFPIFIPLQIGTAIFITNHFGNKLIDIDESPDK